MGNTDKADRPRTVQFLLERTCSIEGGETSDIPVGLPYPLWVFWPAADPIPYDHEKCDSKHYKLTPDSCRALGISFVTPWVCEHMGHLIE